jgi:DHA1 family multidrug resistance protein-like MFS transporter
MRRADDPPRGPGSVDPDQPTASEPAPSPERAFSGDAVESTLPGGKPGDRPIAWKRNLYAIVAAQTLAIVGFSLRVPFLPFYLEDLGVSTVEGQALWSGLVNAAGAGVMAISAPIWGVVADRRGRRPMLMRATFAATITVGLMSLATAPWHLLGLRLIEGALSGTVTAATALVATNTPKARLGYGLGLVQTAVFSGAFLGPLIVCWRIRSGRDSPSPSPAVASPPPG